MQVRTEVLSCKTAAALRQLLRCSLENYGSSALSTFGSEVYDMVCTFDDIHVVLNHQYGVTTLNKSVESV